MSVKLNGIILELITDLFMVQDGFTVGEKLAQVEKTAGSKFCSMSNDELYESLKTTIKTDYYSDEPMTEKEKEEFLKK